MKRTSSELKTEIKYACDFAAEMVAASTEHKDNLYGLLRKSYLTPRDLGLIYLAISFLNNHGNDAVQALGRSILRKTHPEK